MKTKILLIFLMLICFNAYSSIVINGTRFIYNESDKEITVKITNAGQSPVLVQSWMDDGDAFKKPEEIRVPFIVSPPINRIDPKKSQTLRISYTGLKKNHDRESVYWLNVLEIPQTKPTAPDNKLQIAFRSRLKLFYRPKGLLGNAVTAGDSLSWSFESSGLTVENKSPFSVSIISVTLKKSGQTKVYSQDMLLPFTKRNVLIDSKRASDIESLSYDYINDWGAVISRHISF
ncbi:fimbrial biogenesis chaperone [Serratia sarumanii]|uniref:fimbrial biogenesis chaperone n=1 Tax=Serratia sarumanii TaxID=3020826 RepID=UPI003F7E16B7